MEEDGSPLTGGAPRTTGGTCVVGGPVQLKDATRAPAWLEATSQHSLGVYRPGVTAPLRCGRLISKQDRR